MGDSGHGFATAHAVLIIGEVGIAEVADIMSVISCVVYILAAIAARSSVFVVGDDFAVKRGQPISVILIPILVDSILVLGIVFLVEDYISCTVILIIVAYLINMILVVSQLTEVIIPIGVLQNTVKSKGGYIASAVVGV